MKQIKSWERDLGKEMELEQWEEIWEQEGYSSSIQVLYKARFYRVLHRWYLSLGRMQPIFL